MNVPSVVLNALGGLALFLYGLRILSSALKRAIGERMRSLIETLTGRACRGVIVGALTSGILQSSSMTMVLLIGLINAGALTLRQGIGVMLGSEIGTTLTAQIVAFRIGRYYLPIIALGFALSEVFRQRKLGDVGRIMLGFGLLFLGMSLLSGGLEGLSQSPVVLRLLESCGSNVVLGAAVGAGVTAIIQSSSAMTAMIIAMGAAEILTLPAAIAMILGANIGTTLTAQIASIGSSLSSRRLALSQLLTNVIGVVAFLPLVPLLARLIAATAASLPRQIANAHSLFNVAVTLALMPGVGALVWMTKRLVRGMESSATLTPQFLSSSLLSTPSVALTQARREVLRMADLSAEMLLSCQRGLLSSNRSELATVFETEEAVDSLKRAIAGYLDRIPTDALSVREEGRLHVLQHVTADIERVGDQAVNIAERGQALLKNGLTLSAEANEDLADMFEKTYAFLVQAIQALQQDDGKPAEVAFDQEGEIDRLEGLYKERHLRRIESGTCDPKSGLLFTEILHNLERTGDHALNIACDVLHCP